MCGLLGIAVQKGSSLSPDLAGYLLNRLMNANEGRGGDSYGLGLVLPESKDVRLFKTVGRISTQNMNNKTWRHGVFGLMDAVASGQTVVALGHNRKATTGKNTERNAHPFLCGKPDREDFVLGAHNGILSPWQEIIAEWDLKGEHMEVDSEIIFRGMQKFASDPKHRVERPDIKVLSELIPLGMIASTYMKDMKTLNLYQGDNPLSISLGDGFALWSSLKLHLDDHTFGLNVKNEMVGPNRLARLDLDTFKVSSETVLPSRTLSDLLDPPFHGAYSRPRGTFHGRYSTDQQRRYENNYERAFGAKPEVIEEATKGDNSISSLKPYGYHLGKGDTDAEVPDISVSSPRNKEEVAACCCCKGYSNSDDGVVEEVELWELLWHRGEGMCATCYYYMVQSDAEKIIRERLHA